MQTSMFQPVTPTAGQAPKRVLMIVTGGTVCMRPSVDTGSLNMSDLSCASLSSMLKELPVLKNPTLPHFDVIEWEELLDSSDIESHHWTKIAEQIQSNYQAYDGFVVLHGSDTLSLTASALSFIFRPRNLAKTIVITGSMLPISHINTDAPRNLCVSLLVAAFSQLNDVVVCFGSRILRGCRTVKTNCNTTDAFDTPNYPHLGQIGIEITINESKPIINSPRWQHAPTMSFDGPIPNLMTDRVCILRTTPNFNTIIFDQLAANPRRPFGIILQLYGTGTAPSTTKFRDAIKSAIDKGITIVAVTQCQSGSCSLITYSNGVKLHSLGIIEGKDLTAESAFVKLAYLFTMGYNGPELANLMEKNLVGELREYTNSITGQGTLQPTADATHVRVEDNDHFKQSVARLRRI